MSFMSFLGNAEVTPKQKVVTVTRKERNPITSELRVFRNGSIFPSAVAVQKYGLEYQPKLSDVAGNGFDVIDGRHWANLKSERPALFISPVSRNEAKVDVFGQCEYTNGLPSTSVMEQGANTFGKRLLQMIEEVYGYSIPEGSDHIDLRIVEDEQLQSYLDTTLKGVFHFPKLVSRGEKKGQMTYVRRENARVFGLVPSALLEVSANPAELTHE